MLDDPLTEPRGKGGRAPDRSVPAAGCRCGNTARTTRWISLSSAPAPAAARWPAGWPRRVFRCRVWMPGRGCGRWRISPPTKQQQTKLYWTDDGSATATIRCSLARTTAARRSAAAPCISPWCRCASGRSGSSRARKLGYGADWPLDWREMWRYYAEVEQALKIAGPVNYPWGPPRPRYPYRAHELNAAALVLARRLRGAGHCLGADAAGDAVGAARAGASLRLSRLLRHRLLHQRQAERAGHLDSARRARPVRKSATWRWSAASRRTTPGRCTGVHYHREGTWRFQQARNVVVAGYAIETPRLLLNSANEPLSGRSGQQLRAGRPQSDGAGEPGGLGPIRRRRSAGTRGRRRSR